MSYEIKLICTSTKELRETTTTGEGAQIISSWLIFRAVSPPEAHMHKPRGARGTEAGGSTNHGPQSNENLVQVSPRTVPAKPLVPVSQHDTHPYMIAGPALDITFWIKGIAAWGGT